MPSAPASGILLANCPRTDLVLDPSVPGVTACQLLTPNPRICGRAEVMYANARCGRAVVIDDGDDARSHPPTPVNSALSGQSPSNPGAALIELPLYGQLTGCNESDLPSSDGAAVTADAAGYHHLDPDTRTPPVGEQSRSFPTPPPKARRRSPADPLPAVPPVAPRRRASATPTSPPTARSISVHSVASQRSFATPPLSRREHAASTHASRTSSGQSLRPRLPTPPLGSHTAMLGEAGPAAPWFHGTISREEAERRLSQTAMANVAQRGGARGTVHEYSHGLFLVRARADRSYVLSVITPGDPRAGFAGVLGYEHHLIVPTTPGQPDGGLTINSHIQLAGYDDVAQLITALQHKVDPRSKLALIGRGALAHGICRQPCLASSFPSPVVPRRNTSAP